MTQSFRLPTRLWPGHLGCHSVYLWCLSHCLSGLCLLSGFLFIYLSAYLSVSMHVLVSPDTDLVPVPDFWATMSWWWGLLKLWDMIRLENHVIARKGSNVQALWPMRGHCLEGPSKQKTLSDVFSKVSLWELYIKFLICRRSNKTSHCTFNAMASRSAYHFFGVGFIMFQQINFTTIVQRDAK
jgi:hypothetical protein